MPTESSSPRAIIVGAGGITGAWMPVLKAEGVTVAAIVDLRHDAALALAANHGLDAAVAHDDLARALAAVPADFVLDLTIPDAHHPVTTAALDAGLPVIGEKPMAATMAQAIDLVAASERTGKLFMTSQSRRYESRHASVRATIATGQLGTLTNVDCDFYLAAH
ncbi:Gfo/Idh/MocA family oxidoreductase, partial [bacterium]